MGANAAVAVQRLGGRAIYWGRVGDDQTGDEVLWLLTHEGIDVSGVRRLAGFRTKIASILIDARGERLAVSAQPQGYPPDASWLPVDRVAEADAVLADTRWPTGAQRLFEAAAEYDLPSVFDGDGGDPEQVATTARQCTHPFFSQPMLAHFGYGAPEQALPRVFGGRNVVAGVTLGAHGVMWFDGDRVRTMASPRVKAVDTLAAGDTWHGAMALALAEGRPTAEAMEFASAVAALKCTRFGGRASIPRRDEFERWWAEQRGVAAPVTG
jgi:sulfofructose kinase